MKLFGRKEGFTFNELLVVVLILGILAALGTPIYTKAVKKSRASDALHIMSIVSEQQEKYYIDNNDFAKDFKTLKLSVKGFEGTAGNEKSLGRFKYILSNDNNQACIKAQYITAGTETGYTLFRNYETQNQGCMGEGCKDLISIIREGDADCGYEPPPGGTCDPCPEGQHLVGVYPYCQCVPDTSPTVECNCSDVGFEAKSLGQAASSAQCNYSSCSNKVLQTCSCADNGQTGTPNTPEQSCVYYYGQSPCTVSCDYTGCTTSTECSCPVGYTRDSWTITEGSCVDSYQTHCTGSRTAYCNCGPGGWVATYQVSCSYVYPETSCTLDCDYTNCTTCVWQLDNKQGDIFFCDDIEDIPFCGELPSTCTCGQEISCKEKVENEKLLCRAGMVYVCS